MIILHATKQTVCLLKYNMLFIRRSIFIYESLKYGKVNISLN